MRDILIAAALLVFICIGFPVMKRLDRFLNSNLRHEEEREEGEDGKAGKG